MPYTKQELKEELLRCYEEHGEVTTELLNDTSTNYPTQATYHNNFGSLAKARESVGIISGYLRKDVVEDITKCYEKHGEVSSNVLNDDDDLVSYNVIYDHFGSLEEAIKCADIPVDDAKRKGEYGSKKYTEEQLLQSLVECKEVNGNTKTSTVNEYDGCPSVQPYRDRFGSITAAREKAGIDVSVKNSNRIQSKIQNCENYDEDAGAHIYVLEITVNGEQAYYVGETTNLLKRLQSHIYRTEIQSWANGPYGKILAPRSETNKLNSISVDKIRYVLPMYKHENEDEIEFRRRRKFKEHHEHISVAMDMNTLDVYGGR